MWQIDKTFSFCYGHRVWSQSLQSDFCEKGDASCKCKHLHGHEGLVKVFLQSDKLESGMVTDFKHLGWLKDFIDRYLDHKFIIDKNDPVFVDLVEAPLHTLHILSQTNQSKSLWYNDITLTSLGNFPFTVGQECNFENLPNNHEYGLEVLSGMFIVNFVPTSENFAKWLFDIVSYKMSSFHVKVSRVEWWETPKSRSVYQV